LWKGVHLIKKFDPENRIGTAGQFVYDLNCILDSRKRNYDVILQLGYTSNSIWNFLLPKKSVIITNMDGLEWKRQQYSNWVRRFLKKAEKWAALKSDYLIADSRGIQNYLQEEYGKSSAYIAYGAELITCADEEVLKETGLEKYSYDLLISRMEPENNIEMIIRAHLMCATAKPLIIIGKYTNKFGSYLYKKYSGEKIKFLGPVFNLQKLNSLRFYSHFYFHGHSAGGTNPSLLEAMASYALIIAHDNVFNKAVLGEDAFYFTSAGDLASLLSQNISREAFGNFLKNNALKIEKEYSWSHIVDLLENLFQHATNSVGIKAVFPSTPLINLQRTGNRTTETGMS
jgi:glycosyltransferase involved in cell wall biosynthesis